MATKQSLRTDVRIQRTQLGAVWIMEESARICAGLCQLPEVQAARCIGCYLAMPEEVQTRPFIRHCWQSGVHLYVPAARDGVYSFARLAPDTRMTIGRMNIEEPAMPQWLADERLNLIVVPGVAFDVLCGRLGHGAGCYDRLLSLAAARAAFKVGAAFEFQVFDRVPMDRHDVVMNAVVTERRCVRSGVTA